MAKMNCARHHLTKIGDEEKNSARHRLGPDQNPEGFGASPTIRHPRRIKVHGNSRWKGWDITPHQKERINNQQDGNGLKHGCDPSPLTLFRHKPNNAYNGSSQNVLLQRLIQVGDQILDILDAN
jgi:hypothetical protein